MLDIIQYKDVKKYKKYIPFDICTNSRLYFDKDLTPGNILLNKETNDIKICDLDSLILNDGESNELDLKKLLIFVLFYLILSL